MKKKVGPLGRVVGLDFTEKYAGRRHKKLAETDLVNLEFVQGDCDGSAFCG